MHFLPFAQSRIYIYIKKKILTSECSRNLIDDISPENSPVDQITNFMVFKHEGTKGKTEQEY